MQTVVIKGAAVGETAFANKMRKCGNEYGRTCRNRKHRCGRQGLMVWSVDVRCDRYGRGYDDVRGIFGDGTTVCEGR